MNDFIAFAGNIGCGKTTAAELVAQHLKRPVFYEPVLENRFLTDYYKDMGRWAFTLQMEYLLKRCHHHDEAETGVACVQDRSLIEDPEVFALYLHDLGFMTDAELDLYRDYFDRHCQSLKMPDLIVLLATDDLDLLTYRIAKRGREAERSITQDFLGGLNHYYQTFAERARERYGVNVVTVDITDLDFERPKDAEVLFEIVESVG